MWAYIVAWVVMSFVAGFVWYRLKRTDMDAVTVANAERRLGAKAALQFALDNGLPLKTSEGETDGHNVCNARNVSGLRVPGDLSGGSR